MADITTTLPTDPAITSIGYGSQSSSTVVNTNFDNLASATNALIDRSSESEDVTDEHRTWLDLTMSKAKVNAALKWESGTQVSFTADAVAVSNAGGVKLLESVSVAASSTFNSGESATADTGYCVWLVCKDDGSVPFLMQSVQTTFAGLTMPSGYSTGYGRRVGWVVYDAAATPLLEPFSDLRDGYISLMSTKAITAEPGYETTTVNSGNMPFETASYTSWLPPGCAIVRLVIALREQSGQDVYLYAGTSATVGKNWSTLVCRADSNNSTTIQVASMADLEMTSTGTVFFDATYTGVSADAYFAISGWYDNW